MRFILDFGFWILGCPPGRKTRLPGKVWDSRPRLLSHALLLSVVLSTAVWGDCFLAPEPFGTATAPFMTGNGRLTVGVDASGRISVCRWPRPSDANQVCVQASTETAAESEYGLAWGMGLSDGTVCLGDAPWKVTQEYDGDAPTRIRTRFELPGASVAASQTVFVCPERDVLVVQLTLQDASIAQPIYWLADFSPCTRQVPEWPAANDVFATLKDFAAYTPDHGRTMIHFRPRNPGIEEWSEAEHLAEQPAATTAPQWSSFDEGVWIAYGSPNEVLGFQCGEEGTVTSAFKQASEGKLDNASAVVGSCDSALALRPLKRGNVASVKIMVALGENAQKTSENLSAALRRGYDALLQETDDYWNKRLSGATLPAVNDNPLLFACKRDLVTLLQSTDPRSGAIVRSSVRGSLLALDWVRDGAWTTFALDRAGYHDMAEQHTLFYAGAFRELEKRGKPYGSMPAGLFTNGVEGVPHMVLDADAVAWTLGSFWRHGTFLDGTARRTYLASAWNRLAGAADFLAAWTDGRTRQPLYSFDYELCRDGPSQDRLLTTYMGMDAALRMAQALTLPPPEEWARRKRELDALIRFHCVDKSGRWNSDATLPFWQPEIAETELPSWAASVERRLDEADRSGSPDMAALCETALVWQGQPEKLARLRPHLGELDITRGGGSDALAAAQHFIAASIIYAPPKIP